MDAEIRDGNFPKFVHYVSYEREQYQLFSIQMEIFRFQCKIGKLSELVCR